MRIRREWITPVISGAFLITAVTGILMFFHMAPGATKVIHEWISLILVGGVAFHVTVNLRPLKTYLSAKRGALIMGAFLMVLAVGFLPIGKQRESQFVPAVRALTQVPLTTLAQVARITPQQLSERLSKAGLQPASEEQKLSDLTGDDMGKQLRVLSIVLSESR